MDIWDQTDKNKYSEMLSTSS